MNRTLPMHRPARTLRGIVAFAAFAAAGGAAAQSSEPIATDRPDVVESSDVVGPGRVQIEAGYARERDDEGGTRMSASTFPMLLRVGLGERTELRLESDTRSRVRVDGLAEERGTADASIGFKWRQRDDDPERGHPAIAWLAHLDLDTGSAAFRGNGVRPSLRMVAEWELPGDWSLGVMPGLFTERDAAGDRFVGGIFAVTVGRGWTPRFRTFVELAAERIARSRHGGSTVALDVGASWLLTPSMQFDAAYAHGLNRHTADHGWTVGFSVRF